MIKSILDPEVHERLIADLQHVCETANIPRYMVETSAGEYCGPEELQWLRDFPANREACRGLILTGYLTPPPETRMMAMTGALLRNFIDARLIPMNTLVEAAKEGEAPTPSVVLIPNLYIRQVGRTLPSWQIQSLYDLLLTRLTSCRLTVAYVDSMPALAKEYGQTFADHLLAHYQIIGGSS